MKKLMPLLDKNTKSSKPNPELSKSFIRPSKSQIFLVRKHKKSTSPDTKKPQMSKNDQRITIYTDITGFIVDYSTLVHGLKCECYITETSVKRSSKTLKLQSVQPRQNLSKKKIKLQITLGKHHITTIKNGVQHIFSLSQESKQNFLKVVLTQNWQIQQFTIPNKKTKISQFQSLSITQNNIDQVYPLKNIIEADELRKNKLIKSDSKLKISWGNPQKQHGEESTFDMNKSEILSFGSEKSLGEMSRSTIVEPSKQFQRSAFLRKSWNQCDLTRDSEEDQMAEEKIFQKKVGNTDSKLSKSINIDLSMWNYSQIMKESIKSPFRESNFQSRILGQNQELPIGQKFFK